MASLEILGEKLTFGIEIELLIRPKQKLLPTLERNGWTEKASRVIWNEWNEMEKEIAAIQKSSKRVAAQEKLSYRTAFSKVKEVRRSLHIALRDMLVEKQIGAGLTTVNYEKSAIVDEPSLDELHAHKLRLHRWTVLTCRLGSVEIVSRSISASKEWQGEIDHVFQLINENFDIYLSTGCSMHVHVSPAPLESHVYNLGQLQSILKATALYDKAITNVMPADRKENPYCQPNLAPRREKRHQSEKDINNHIRDAFERVESQGWKGLFAQFDNLRPIQKNLIQLVFFGESRYLSWNFAHLASSCGTIEFRRPPGLRDAAAAKHWIAFTLGFLSGALALAHTFDPNSKTHATVEDLLELIETGHSTLPSYCQGARNPALLQVDSSSPHRYSGAELTAIKRKKEAKKDKRSNFVEKLRSQPNSPAHD